jgi:putative endonuclease
MDIPSSKPQKTGSSKQSGDAAEDEALRYLQTQGLQLLQRNYRTPGRGGGEIDLIMAAPDGTTVFVEVRSRSSSTMAALRPVSVSSNSGVSYLPHGIT